MTRVAAIDCGTNSIRLLVADVTVGTDGSSTLRDVHREMRIVRLGQGVDATGELAPEAVRRTADALADYAVIARRKGAQAVRMVATSATRDARNRDEFFGMTAELLAPWGGAAEVISGDEEAALSFSGAVGDLDPADGPFLVMDVGGGSTELVLGDWDGTSASITAARSVDIGCVRITERCLPGDPPTAAEIAAGAAFAGEMLAEAFAAVPVARARTWVGVAGTVTTLSAVAQGLTEYDSERTHLSRLSRADLDRIAATLLTADHATRSAMGAVHPGRVDVIGGGALIVRTAAGHLADTAGISELLVSEHDILDGIALSISPAS